MLGLGPVILTDFKWQKKNLVVQIITAPGCLPLCWHVAAPEAEMSDSLLNWFQSHCSFQPVYYSQLKLISVNVNKLGWTWCGYRSILVTRPGAFALKVATAIREETGEGFNLLLSLPEPLFPNPLSKALDQWLKGCAVKAVPQFNAFSSGKSLWKVIISWENHPHFLE